MIKQATAGNGGPARPRVRWLTTRPAAGFLAATAILIGAGWVAIAASPGTAAQTVPGCRSARSGALTVATGAAQSCQSGRSGAKGRSDRSAAAGSRAGISWAGVWRSAASYTAGDVVFYQGSSYIAIAAGAGRLPSMSPHFWAVMAAGGQLGPRGAAGPAGPAGPQGPGGSSAYAEFYALPVTAPFILPGSDVPFDQTGPSSGSVITRYVCGPNTEFGLAVAGTYEVTFQVPLRFSGQLGLTLDRTLLSYTVVGTATNSQLVGNALVQTTQPGQVLSVQNPSGGTYPVIIESSLLGRGTLSDSLVIKLLSATQSNAPLAARPAAGIRRGTAGSVRQGRQRAGC